MVKNEHYFEKIIDDHLHSSNKPYQTAYFVLTNLKQSLINKRIVINGYRNQNPNDPSQYNPQYVYIQNLYESRLKSIINTSKTNHYKTSFSGFSKRHTPFVEIQTPQFAVDDHLNIQKYIIPYKFVCFNYQKNYVISILTLALERLSSVFPKNAKLDIDIHNDNVYAIINITIYNTKIPFIYTTSYAENASDNYHSESNQYGDDYTSVKYVSIIKNLKYNQETKSYQYPLALINQYMHHIVDDSKLILKTQKTLSNIVNTDLKAIQKSVQEGNVSDGIDLVSFPPNYYEENSKHKQQQAIDIAEAYRQDSEFKNYLEKLI